MFGLGPFESFGFFGFFFSFFLSLLPMVLASFLLNDVSDLLYLTGTLGADWGVFEVEVGERGAR